MSASSPSIKILTSAIMVFFFKFLELLFCSLNVPFQKGVLFLLQGGGIFFDLAEHTNHRFV